MQTNTVALTVHPLPERHEGTAKWEVQTERGTVRGKQVVLATNAYTNVLHRGIADTGFLNPGRSQVTALRPENDLSGHPAQGKSFGIDRGAGDYLVIRAPGLRGAGDIVYGGGRAISPTREMGIMDDSTINPKIEKCLKQSGPEVFGRETWGEKSVEVRDWSGITCYTPDTLPLVGEVPSENGLWASVGMNGHGMAMAMAFRSAEALVTMMTTGKEPDWFPKAFRIERAWNKPKMDVPPEGASLGPVAVPR